ncbi:MAG: beta-lactamase family protein, partial [Gemmatimonadetes bacterium]|nr:beta-lactamase family protein [Gemmatimonadota bacterium]
MRLGFYVAGLLAVVAMGAVPGEGQTHAGFDEAWQDVADLWRRQVEEQGVVGSSLAFLHPDGELLAFETAGLADEANGRPVTEETIYHWASITKTFTGIAILQLRDRDRLDLDDPILQYVPELAAVHDPFGRLSEITIRHLLSHSAGFRASTFPWGGGEDWHPHEPADWEQLVAMLPYTTLLFEPGERFSYSNPGIVFLGQVIERLTGEDWEVYVDKNVLRPLGMSRAYFDVTPYHLVDHRSNNYFVQEGRAEAQGLDFDTGITVSNGGL